jgi:hypothetical protein
MSTDTDTKVPPQLGGPHKRGGPRTPLLEIPIAGDILMRRELFARTVLGVSERTAARMGLPTTYIAGLTYVARAASLKVVADKLQRRNRTAKRRAR